MNIEELIMNGASEEEISAAIAKVQAEKAEMDKQTKAREEKAEKETRKEALKAEARAYIINAALAYATAFDLIKEEEGFSEEEIEKIESIIKDYETMIPMWVNLAKLQDKMDKEFGFGFKI